MADTPRRRYSDSPSPRRKYGRSRSQSRSRSHSRPVSRSRSPSKSRSPARRDNSSRDDVSNPGNNLYVTGLSARVVEKDLEEHFSQEGKVIDCRIVVDPRTRESRGFGFVTMATLEDAERCVKYLNRSTLEGRIITVEKAKRKRARTPTPGSYLGVRVAVRPRSYGRYRDGRDGRDSRDSYSSRRSPQYSPYRGSRERNYDRDGSPYYSGRSYRRERSRSPAYSPYRR
uniref:RRM domain-containing protein n=1 Tax=Araucaria cunninghamii TaxID=56994 RepID=A0A0D6QT30_ARACU